MIKENKQILKEGELALKNKWAQSILVTLTFFLIMFLILCIKKSGSLWRDSLSETLQIIIIGPLTLGFTRYFLELSRKENPIYETIFTGFLDFKRSFLASILTGIYIILRLILLIIPGIIAIIDYSLVYYILLEDPEISSNDAILKSKRMIYGHRKQYFYLNLRFIGLSILCIFTLFIGFLWLIPYIYVCNSIFYEEVKKQYLAERILIE